eukprot:6172992-Pleurochrysis_carterae.AAC.3
MAQAPATGALGYLQLMHSTTYLSLPFDMRHPTHSTPVAFLSCPSAIHMCAGRPTASERARERERERERESESESERARERERESERE